VVSNRDNTGKMEVIKFVDQAEPRLLTQGVTTADLISSIPGVSLNGQGGSLQAYSVRGFSRARIQTLLAGVPLTTERRAGVSASFLDPFLFDYGQVIKGPTSTLYGSGAMGGIVSLTEKHFDGVALIASTYTEGDQKMVGAGWGSDRFSIGAAYRRHYRSDDTSGNRLNDAMERLSASLVWTDELSDAFSFKGVVIAADGKDMGKSSADYPDNRITEYPNEAHYLTHWQLSHDGTKSNWTLGIYGHKQYLDTEVFRPNQSTSLAETEESEYGANWIHLWRNNRWTYRLGFDLKERDVTRDENITTDVSSTSFTSLSGDQESIAGFVDSQWQGEQLTGHLGARYTRITQDSGSRHDADSQWIGTASLKYQVNQDWSVYGQLGTGFRFPELTEKFFNGTTPRGLIIGSPDLEPETSVNQEAGFVGYLGMFHVRGSLFKTRVHDYIERIPIDDRVLTYRNLSNGTIKGAELSIDYDLSEFWLISMRGHWLDGEDNQDQNLADINPPRIGLHLNYTKNWGTMNLSYRHRFSTGRVGSQELPIDSFDRLSASLLIKIRRDLELKIWADNALDDDFRLTPDDLSPLSTRRGYGLSILWQQSAGSRRQD
jgi:outer membrane receptor protein involved in Fe transport